MKSIINCFHDKPIRLKVFYTYSFILLIAVLSVRGGSVYCERRINATLEITPDDEIGTRISLTFNLSSMGEYEQMPMLILSSYDEQIYAEWCLRAGARGCNFFILFYGNSSYHHKSTSHFLGIMPGERAS